MPEGWIDASHERGLVFSIEKVHGELMCTDAHRDDEGVIRVEDVWMGKAPPEAFRRGFGVRAGGLVVSLP
jgi:hypothetical protein